MLIGFFVVTYVYRSYTETEKITLNTDIGLNQIIQKYGSGEYEEIIIQGSKIEAKKPAQDVPTSGSTISKPKVIKKRDVDTTIIPDNVEITDLGFPDPKNPTKVTIKEE